MGVDVIYAGSGNDVIVVGSDFINTLTSAATSRLAMVDGGSGTDTLRLSGGANLNLTKISNVSDLRWGSEPAQWD